MGGHHERKQILQALKKMLDDKAPLPYRDVRVDDGLLGYTDDTIKDYINRINYAVEQNEDGADMVVDPTKESNDLDADKVLA